MDTIMGLWQLNISPLLKTLKTTFIIRTLFNLSVLSNRRLNTHIFNAIINYYVIHGSVTIFFQPAFSILNLAIAIMIKKTYK